MALRDHIVRCSPPWCAIEALLAPPFTIPVVFTDASTGRGGARTDAIPDSLVVDRIYRARQ
jgi:hypothetical protein